MLFGEKKFKKLFNVFIYNFKNKFLKNIFKQKIFKKKTCNHHIKHDNCDVTRGKVIF